MTNTDADTIARTVRIGILQWADTFHVTASDGHVDIAVRPAAALRPATELDWFRIIRDDETLIVVHFTGNGVNRGELRLRGTMTGMLVGIIRELIESTF